jgi:hypothetical protein
MSNDPSPESVAKAARLRAQIEKLTNADAAAADQAPQPPGEKPPISPREFIERQMKKLDGEK